MSGMDDISAPSELERNLDLLLEARSNYEKNRSNKKEGAKLDNEAKESAAQMIIDAGMRMKVKMAIADGDDGGLGDADSVPPSAPSPASGGRGKDLGPRKTPKRKREETEDKESFQESLLTDLASTKKFLQDFLVQTTEQDRKAAVEKKELMENSSSCWGRFARRSGQVPVNAWAASQSGQFEGAGTSSLTLRCRRKNSGLENVRFFAMSTNQRDYMQTLIQKYDETTRRGRFAMETRVQISKFLTDNFVDIFSKIKLHNAMLKK